MVISLTEKDRLKDEGGWPDDLNQFTPLMRQFLEIKYKYDLDVLLFFRVGDFYETFFEDAKIISRELELTLTSRAETNYPGGKIPMAGVPAKAVVTYVSKLLSSGYKVAVCDQMEDPATCKGIVRREVTKLLTPGTLLQSEWLPASKNNYIASICKDKKTNLYGLAYADFSCGDFYFAQVSYQELILELNRLMPSEILVPTTFEKKESYIVSEKVLDIDLYIRENWNCTGIDKEYFTYEYAKKRLKEEINIISLNAIGGSDFTLGHIASGAILSYLDVTHVYEKPKFEKLTPYFVNSFLNLDKTTRKNLELVETLKDKSYEGSLLWAIDFTETNMGRRKLRAWLEQPLVDIELINYRLDCIEELIKNKNVLYNISENLKTVFDLERISTKLSAGSVNARELIALKESLLQIPKLAVKLSQLQHMLFKEIVSYPPDLNDAIEIIEKSILDNPSSALNEGSLIKSSFSQELKELRDFVEGGDNWLCEYETIQKQKTGIKNLKVGFNRIFGYFIEVSKGNLPLVPKEYVCKQTMVNSSRFITNELKEFEHKALNAEQKVKSLEYEIFCNVREEVKTYSKIIKKIASDISTLDAIASLAKAAITNNYKRPLLDNSLCIELKASRHPIIEKKIGFNNFISNDCFLSGGSNNEQLIILTGPNMAGKSTYMRQIALCIILAQMGSFVPCDLAKIGVVDQIFTRVGAVDDISEGESTFMIEMLETSQILNTMTTRSLILLDEVGRGTSTYDGVAIAWALAEYLVKINKPRTIFATHFHELNGLAGLYTSISNYQVTVKEEAGHVIFLRKVIPGGADKSYGIEVAKMAGLPKELLNRAKSIMHAMHNKAKSPVKKETIKTSIESGQLSLFH